VTSAPTTRRNASFYVDYQDCKALGGREMLCAGVSSDRVGASALYSYDVAATPGR